MYSKVLQTIDQLKEQEISSERKNMLAPLIDFIEMKLQDNKTTAITFICTHNSRRSHLAQVWAQAASAYFNIPNIVCYSGGTEETEIFPTILATLVGQGFLNLKISDSDNPVYAIKYDQNSAPIIGFSKKYDHPFNPVSDFAAVMTCSQADGGCPFIAGAEQRIPITFEDPKISDHTSTQSEVYRESSLQIGAEMVYVFSQVKNRNLYNR